MKSEWMTIVANDCIAEDTFEMRLTGDLVDEMTQPGQFLHLQVGDGWEYVLRRPISIADVCRDQNMVTVLYKVVGQGTKQLSRLSAGDQVNILGPRGNGFNIEGVVNQSLILVGGGIGVPPLYYLGKKLIEQGNKLTFVLGFQSEDAVFYESQFQELGNVIVTTDDGSYGRKGFVTSVLPELENNNSAYYACGPKGMLKAITTTLPNMEGYISLEERMGCGVGACFACVCEPTVPNKPHDYRKICVDGPVFSAKEVIL